MSALLLGKSQVDITPPVGMHLAGWAGERYSDRVHEPLTCRVLDLQQDQKIVVLVSLDLIGLDAAYADEIRAAAEEQLGIPAKSIMLSASHTHSSPILPPCLFPGHPDPDSHYMEDLKRKVVGAILAAREGEHTPVSVGFGRGQGDLGVNRRLPYDNGKSGYPPKADPTQPIDREIGVLRFDDRDGRIVAVLFSYACHPTVGGNTHFIGPDYPGAARKLIEDFCGKQAMASFILGNCGEIRANYTNPDETFRWDVDTNLVESAGHRIGAEVIRVLEQMETTPEVELATGQAFGNLYTTTDEFAARCEFQAIRIGNAVIVSNPGECFSGIGMKVRERVGSPLLFSSITNGFLGYVPTKAAYPYGGYEVSTSYEFFGLRAPIRSDGEEVFIEGMTEAVKQCFPRSRTVLST